MARVRLTTLAPLRRVGTCTGTHAMQLHHSVQPLISDDDDNDDDDDDDDSNNDYDLM